MSPIDVRTVPIAVGRFCGVCRVPFVPIMTWHVRCANSCGTCVTGATAGDTERPCDWNGGLRGFTEWALTFTKNRTGGVPSTIDGADGQAVTRASLPDGLIANESGVTYHGYWHYDHMNWCTGNESDVTRWWALRAAQYLAIARNLSKPVAITEFGSPECYCASATGVMAGGLGWILWELISDHGTQFGKWGLVFANGSSAVTPSVMDCIKRLTQN